MKTGDLVLFSSDVSIMRTILRFTHVGVIIDDFVLEMHGATDRGTGNLRNYFEGGRPTGPKLYDLRARIASYPGRVWIAPLLLRRSFAKMDLSRYRDLEYHDAYVSHYLRFCVANRWFGLANRWFGLANRCSKPSTSVFCAEFVGMVLRDVVAVDVDDDVGCLTPSSLATLTAFGAPERVTCFVEHG